MLTGGKMSARCQAQVRGGGCKGFRQVLLRAQPDRQEGALRPAAARSQGARQPVGLHVKAVGVTSPLNRVAARAEGSWGWMHVSTSLTLANYLWSACTVRKSCCTFSVQRDASIAACDPVCNWMLQTAACDSHARSVRVCADL